MKLNVFLIKVLSPICFNFHYVIPLPYLSFIQLYPYIRQGNANLYKHTDVILQKSRSNLNTVIPRFCKLRFCYILGFVN